MGLVFNLLCLLSRINLFFKGRKARQGFLFFMAGCKYCSLFSPAGLLCYVQLFTETLQQWLDLPSDKLKKKQKKYFFTNQYNTNQGKKSPHKLRGKSLHIDRITSVRTLPWAKPEVAFATIILFHQWNEAGHILVVAIGWHELVETTSCEPNVDLQNRRNVAILIHWVSDTGWFF